MYEEFSKGRSTFYQNTKHLLEEELYMPDITLSKEALHEKYKSFEMRFLTHQPSETSIRKSIEGFHKVVFNALDEYFQFKYGISDEQLGKVIKNTNNFKLKHNNFQKIVQLGKEFYYDGEVLFLETDCITFTVTKRWEHEG